MAEKTEQSPASPPSGPRRARREDGYDLFIHLFILWLCAGVITASLILDPGPEAVSLFGYEIPSTCIFRNLTGYRCLGCGLTRSFTYLGHGQLLDSFKNHILGPLLYVFVAAQVPYRIIRLFRWVRERRARAD